METFDVVERQKIGRTGDLATPPKLRKLQRKFYRKAKDEPRFRFYALFDKVCREETLWHAWELIRRNGGAPGVDGVTIEQIEQQGEQEWIEELRGKLVIEPIFEADFEDEAYRHMRAVWPPFRLREPHHRRSDRRIAVPLERCTPRR